MKKFVLTLLNTILLLSVLTGLFACSNESNQKVELNIDNCYYFLDISDTLAVETVSNSTIIQTRQFRSSGALSGVYSYCSLTIQYGDNMVKTISLSASGFFVFEYTISIRDRSSIDTLSAKVTDCSGYIVL